MPTVLIVDDSEFDRRLVAGLLREDPSLVVEFADTGRSALEHIRRHQPDAVLTDLQMPEMDGLELVARVRAEFPLIPVILMTGHGSEETAAEALRVGASNYVPKSRLAEELLDVLCAVLAIAKADRHHERLMDCLTRNEMTFELDNDVALIYPLVDMMQNLVRRLGIVDETGRMRVGVALEEALLNALYHGNLELDHDMLRESRTRLVSGQPTLIQQRASQEPYCRRRLQVDVQLSPQEARFVVRDCGCGFDPAAVPDPCDPANLERESGRGLLLMRTFMDEVIFNDTGNQVTLIKQRET